MTRFARIAILDLVVWIISSNGRHLDCVSNNCDNALSKESCNYHGSSLRLDFLRKDSEVWRFSLFGLSASKLSGLAFAGIFGFFFAIGFHSPRVKFPLINICASWCLVSMQRIWIFGSRLILSNSQSRATLWVLETCLIVGLRPLIIILMTASLSSKNVQLRLTLRRMWVSGYIIDIRHLIKLMSSFVSWGLGFLNWALHKFPWFNYCWDGLCCWSIVTLQSLCPKDRQLVRYTRLTLRLNSSFEGRQQNQSLETIPINIVVPCFPHGNTVGIHLCDEYKKSKVPNACRMPEPI